MTNLYVLPREMRHELKAPMAPVRATRAAVAEVRGRYLVAVGDVCSEHFLRNGIVPNVVVADWKTQRGAVDVELRELHALRERAGKDPAVAHAHVQNPAATVTDALWRALETAVADRAGVTLIEVDGEEDLAVLPALVLAPEDAVVAYGQPDEGVVLVPVTRESRERARRLLERMRVPHAP